MSLFAIQPTVDVLLAQDLVTRVRENNEPAISWDKVLGFPDRAASDKWLLENPEKALGAVHFLRDSRSGVINYILQSNSTVSGMLDMANKARRSSGAAAAAATAVLPFGSKGEMGVTLQGAAGKRHQNTNTYLLRMYRTSSAAHWKPSAQASWHCL